MWPEILLSDCGKSYLRKRDLQAHCSTIKIEHTQGDSERKINIFGNESFDNCYRKHSSYEHVCSSEWVPRKRGLFESINTTALWMVKKKINWNTLFSIEF